METTVETTQETTETQVFLFNNVQVVQALTFEKVWITAESEEAAREMLVSALADSNNAWKNATDPIYGELNVIEIEGVEIDTDVIEVDEDIDDLLSDEDEDILGM